jgi:pimeloyl-ACP methyl ester carboxylesterase
VHVRWGEAGEGVPLVLIHGLPTSPSLWRHVAAQITGARVLCWEMLGYGASIDVGRDQNLSLRWQAEYLIGWLDRLGIDRAILGGHDLGGGVAQIAAARYPQRVLGLFLTNSVCYDSWPIAPVQRLRTIAPVVGRMPAPLFRPIFASLIRRGHDDDQRADEAVKVHWRHYARTDGAAAFVRQIRSLDPLDTLEIAEQLPLLNLPVRIVWGADDEYQSIEWGERLASDLGAELHRIEGARHFTPEDHPEIIAQHLNALLAEVRPAGLRLVSPRDDVRTFEGVEVSPVSSARSHTASGPAAWPPRRPQIRFPVLRSPTMSDSLESASAAGRFQTPMRGSKSVMRAAASAQRARIGMEGPDRQGRASPPSAYSFEPPTASHRT